MSPANNTSPNCYKSYLSVYFRLKKPYLVYLHQTYN